MNECEELSREEVWAVVKRLKNGKAMGTDGIPAGVWKYGGEGIWEWVWRTCNRVWKGEG